jgi:predicted Fe-Mo cluster-binding NifX family protein
VPLARLAHVNPLALLPSPDPDEPIDAPILPRRVGHIVAVATSDGQFVDRSLVDAAEVQVYLVGERRTRWLGTRSLPSGMLRRRDGVGVARDLLCAVSDCHAIVATRFSKRAATLLDAVGIRPVIAGGPIEDVLDRVARGTLRRAAADSDEDADADLGENES